MDVYIATYQDYDCSLVHEGVFGVYASEELARKDIFARVPTAKELSCPNHFYAPVDLEIGGPDMHVTRFDRYIDIKRYSVTCD